MPLWIVTLLDTDTGHEGTLAVEAITPDAAAGIAEARLSDELDIDILDAAYSAPRLELISVVLS